VAFYYYIQIFFYITFKLYFSTHKEKIIRDIDIRCKNEMPNDKSSVPSVPEKNEQ
jgi:hypothetical protein